MRLRLILLVVAISSMVLMSFLVPLALVLRTLAADRAVSSGMVRAQSLVPEVSTLPVDELKTSVAQANATDKTQPITVFLPDGTLLGPPAMRSPGVRLAADGNTFSTPISGGVEVLVAVQGLSSGTSAAVIRVFVPDAQMHAGVTRAWLLLGAIGLGLLVLSVAVADQLARSLVRALRALARASDHLAAGDLSARAAVAGPPEMRQVSSGLNHLAARIGELLAHERETAADLSHRLRTPLTALRIDTESLQDDVERAQLMSDVDGIERMVNEIIREARRPANPAAPEFCDAIQVIGDRAAFWLPLADDQDRTMTVEMAPGPVEAGVPGEDLAACADILLENVFAHTPEGTGFSVRVSRRAAGGAWVVVSDAGPGFGDPDAARRGRSGAGSTGLGLDIARRIAEASGGSLTVGPSASGGGAVTAGFGPSAGWAGPGRRHRRVRPPLSRRRPAAEDGRPAAGYGRPAAGDGRPAADDGWPDDPPPWSAVADQGSHHDLPFA
jgi:signal transduction histidine kinase